MDPPVKPEDGVGCRVEHGCVAKVLLAGSRFGVLERKVS